METLIVRLHERLGTRYLNAFYVWITIVAFATAALTLVAAIPYVSASREQLKIIGPIWAATNTVALLACGWVIRRRIAGALAWVKGERSPDLAVRAWNDLVSRMFTLIIHGVVIFTTLAIPGELVAAHILGLPLYGAVSLMFTVSITTVVAGMLDYLGVEVLGRPVLREIATYLPASIEPERPAPALRWRIVLGMTITSLYGVLLGAAIASATFAPATKLLVGVSFSIVLSGTLVLFIASLLSAAVLSPVTDIVDAMRRVGQGDLDATVPMLGADEIGFLAKSFNQMVSGLAEREVLRSAMGTYVDPHVAARILAEGTELEGDQVDVSIMFVDIRDFTASADGQDPRDTVRELNDFFALTVPIVVRHGGHANKFLGDGFLAVFGAPERIADHADGAVLAAIEIVAAVEERYAGSLRVGIGINSGRAVVGSVGGGGRLEFTLIGDTVNVAKRVEQLTKELGGTILFTEATRTRLSNVDIRSERMRSVPMRGKSGSVEVYALRTSDPAADGSEAPSSSEPQANAASSSEV